MTAYKHMSDEQLIRKLREGESPVTDFLMEKYKNLVRKEANAMFLLGGETDDLIQEGMIGLFKAIHDYNLEKDTSFFSFASLCIRRQMYSAIEASQRKKHAPLNSYVSIYDENSEAPAILDTIQAESLSNPEELLLSREYTESLEAKLEESLSSLEKKVLYLHLMGTNYRKIAELIDKSPKTVDNALQRIKAKTQKILEEEK
ncbi:MAG: RNA polymerase sporulation sigma factor SigH [Dorea sp.]|nr:RNA polymerase sporulation sigma factor SigH [Dorea sp.]